MAGLSAMPRRCAASVCSCAANSAHCWRSVASNFLVSLTRRWRRQVPLRLRHGSRWAGAALDKAQLAYALGLPIAAEAALVRVAASPGHRRGLVPIVPLTSFTSPVAASVVRSPHHRAHRTGSRNGQQLMRYNSLGEANSDGSKPTRFARSLELPRGLWKGRNWP